MIKYCFKVFDKETDEQVIQLVSNADDMLDTINKLSKLGIVKGFILDDKEESEDI